MADLSDSQRKRAEARERRRSKSGSKSRADDDGDATSAQDDTAADGEDGLHGVKQAAKVAAAVGAVGAAAAAARALTHHDDDGADEQQAEDEPQPQQEAEPEARAEAEPDARDEPELDEARQEDDRPEPEEQEPEPARDSQPVAGASVGDARKAIDRARSELEELLERPVESVSSFERTHDGWVAALEVVEVQRIPETTDILASYELELDDDLNLRRYQQVRRYHRAQAERGEGS